MISNLKQQSRETAQGGQEPRTSAFSTIYYANHSLSDRRIWKDANY